MYTKTSTNHIANRDREGVQNHMIRFMMVARFTVDQDSQYNQEINPMDRGKSDGSVEQPVISS